MEFKLKNEGYYSFEEEETLKLDDEVEPHTPSLRRSNRVRRPVERYSPPDFHSRFVLFAINDEPRSVKEKVSSEECKLWKNAMVEEMGPWTKMRPGIWLNYMMEGNLLVVNGCSRRN